VMAPGAPQASTLADLAAHCVEVGEMPRAEKVLQEGLETLQREARPGHKAEGHLALAGALRHMGNELGERHHNEQALECLEGLDPVDLALSPALPRLSGLLGNPGFLKTIKTLMKRACKAPDQVHGRAREDLLLALLRAHLSLGDRESADELLTRFERSDYRCRALADMARGLILEEPGDAVDYLRRIELLQERMQAVRTCVVELGTELRPSRQKAVRETLVELTLLSVDDELTADLVLSRWPYYQTRLGILLETMRKMGWGPEEPAPAGAGTIQLKGR
ncbi:MAG: hypothetical protein AB1758_16780, partial [Candidatus Eremiobacterota bacterium]